nr:MAG TPA: hypothetical protein [Bacteriophage sp.]
MNIAFIIIITLALIITIYVFYIIYNDASHVKGFYVLFVIALFTSSIIIGKGISFALWFLPEEWKLRIGYGCGFVLTLLIVDFINKKNKGSK